MRPFTGEVDVRREAEAEFDWWYRTAYPRVARAVFLVVHDRGVAEDIAQDAFVQMLRHWNTVSGYEQPDAWVRRVAIRMAVRRARREYRRPGLELLAGGPPAAPDGGDRTEVVAAIAALSPMQRAAIMLHYWADQPVQEIARTLEVSESTVKQHLFRARGRLAVLLREEVGDDVG
ncbi:RNA polymerase sigma factor [Propionicimonas sp.]|uniref:RNA polymerase sigma factor n=1 Tax=Propionicimonas sp. TaxID=1955623 RepID=UPI0039E386ED